MLIPCPRKRKIPMGISAVSGIDPCLFHHAKVYQRLFWNSMPHGYVRMILPEYVIIVSFWKEVICYNL